MGRIMTHFDAAWYVRFMVRRRWPDVVLAVGVLALLATGVWALWGDELRQWWSPDAPETDQTESGPGMT